MQWLNRRQDRNGMLPKRRLDELDVLGIQVDNYGFHRRFFPVRVAVHEELPDCLRQLF